MPNDSFSSSAKKTSAIRGLRRKPKTLPLTNQGSGSYLTKNLFIDGGNAPSLFNLDQALNEAFSVSGGGDSSLRSARNNNTKKSDVNGTPVFA